MSSDPIDAEEEDWRTQLDDAGMEPACTPMRHQAFHADAGAMFDGLRAQIREAGIRKVARASGVSRMQLHRILGGAAPGPRP